MDKVIYFTEQIFKEGNTYSSYCPELDIASCGNTIEEARKNLYETIEIVFEECRKKGTLKAFLEEMGYSFKNDYEIIPPVPIETEKVEMKVRVA